MATEVTGYPAPSPGEVPSGYPAPPPDRRQQPPSTPSPGEVPSGYPAPPPGEVPSPGHRQQPPSAPPPDTVVSVVRVSKFFGRFAAVNNLTLNVPKGAVYGLIGPNGAGKTTTFSMISTLLSPDLGLVLIQGHDPTRKPREVRKILGYMPDALGVYNRFNVEEYLKFFAAAYKVPAKERSSLVGGLLELVALEDKRTEDVNSLSRGMKQRLSLARALVHDPAVLVLDEPASGLDPRARAELRDLIVQLSEMGKTIIISSHILSELEDICTHVAIMQQGSILFSGLISEITNRILAQNSGVASDIRRLKVRFSDGSFEQFAVRSDDEQADLLRKLMMEDGREVLEVSRVGSSLEEAYLNLTSGGPR